MLGLIDDARLASLFGTNSRAEVAIVGQISLGGIRRKVSGQVDRLAVTESDVLIADYKSDRSVPHGVELIPQQYIGQLAEYRAVLRLVYPNHRVRAALIWTVGPTLTELPESVLDAALSRLGGP